ncbi:hypothetical protein SEA_LEOPARD_96 [Mycobacterium phage Leopard]|nr:hypothetical protein SEA_LEOPARD_96 [Mycobacterium phage Leopard]
MDIINPGYHEHRPQWEGNMKVCQDCRQVIFEPPTQDNNQLLADPLETDHPTGRDFDSLYGMRVPLDYLLIRMTTELDIDTPDYIDILNEEYCGDEEQAENSVPPHTYNGTVRWWVSE